MFWLICGIYMCLGLLYYKYGTCQCNEFIIIYIWEFVDTLNALIYIYQITYFSYVIMEIYNYKPVDWTDSQNIVFLSLAYKEYSIPVLMEILSPL